MYGTRRRCWLRSEALAKSAAFRGIQREALAPESIPHGDDPTNQLTVNDVFAVRTTSGNYAKIKVTAYGTQAPGLRHLLPRLPV
jgi:hypothetical protein